MWGEIFREVCEKAPLVQSLSHRDHHQSGLDGDDQLNLLDV